MQTLFIITKVLKTNGIGQVRDSFNSITASETIYRTYQEAEVAIPNLGKGIYQIQKVFVNEN